MLGPLPEAKTYLPGPGRCIYCLPDNAETKDLRREHIIAQKLGGALILHNASCTPCERLINQQIEIPSLTRFWHQARTHLGLPTSRPATELPIGVWKSDGTLFPDLSPPE